MANLVGNIKGPQGDPGRDGDGATFITSTDGTVAITGDGSEATPFDLSVAGKLIYSFAGSPYSATQGGAIQYPYDANTGKGTIPGGMTSVAAAEFVVATWDPTGVIKAGHGYSVQFDIPIAAYVASGVLADMPPVAALPLVRVFNTNLNPVPGGGFNYKSFIPRVDSNSIGWNDDVVFDLVGYTTAAPSKLWDVRIAYWASAASGMVTKDLTYKIPNINVNVTDLGPYTP